MLSTLFFSLIKYTVKVLYIKKKIILKQSEINQQNAHSFIYLSTRVFTGGCLYSGLSVLQVKDLLPLFSLSPCVFLFAGVLEYFSTYSTCICLWLWLTAVIRSSQLELSD